MSTFKSSLQRLFCLQGLLLDGIKEHVNHIELVVRSPRTSAHCPHCHQSVRRVHKTVHRNIKHGMLNNQVVYLHLRLRDFRCRRCGLFREQIPGISRQSTSQHFRMLVIPKLQERSCAGVAREHHVSPSTILRSMTAYGVKVGMRWPEESFALGIDEHSFSGRDLMITLTDLTHQRLIGILPNDRQATLKGCLRTLAKTKRKLITAVCIDMKQSYAAAVEEVLPAVPIVVDKFHVIQYLNWHLKDLRSIYTRCDYRLPKQLLEKNREELTAVECQQLQRMFGRYPTLKELWHLKEFVRSMYRTHSPQKAGIKYQSILDGLQGDARPRFASLYETFKRWHLCILNYFTHRITNAFTEGVHTKIKLMKRISYGFRNKTHYIAKMTLAFLPLAVLFPLLK